MYKSSFEHRVKLYFRINKEFHCKWRREKGYIEIETIVLSRRCPVIFFPPFFLILIRKIRGSRIEDRYKEEAWIETKLSSTCFKLIYEKDRT